MFVSHAEQCACIVCAVFVGMHVTTPVFVHTCVCVLLYLSSFACVSRGRLLC